MPGRVFYIDFLIILIKEVNVNIKASVNLSIKTNDNLAYYFFNLMDLNPECMSASTKKETDISINFFHILNQKSIKQDDARDDHIKNSDN